MIPKHPGLDSLDIDNPQIVGGEQGPKKTHEHEQTYDIRVADPFIPEPRKPVEGDDYDDNHIINKNKNSNEPPIDQQTGPAGPDPVNVFQIVIVPQWTEQIDW